MRNGLVQHITREESVGVQLVKCVLIIFFRVSYVEDCIDEVGKSGFLFIKPLLRFVVSVTHLSTSHILPVNQVCYFHFLGVFLASKESNSSELISYSELQIRRSNRDNLGIISHISP